MSMIKKLAKSLAIVAFGTAASAQDQLTPYTVTRDCAENSLRGAFAPFAIVIREYDEGVGGFLETDRQVFNSMIEIDPETGFVDWVDAYMYTKGEPYEVGTSKLSYFKGQANGLFHFSFSGQSLSDEATAMVQRVDTLMRNCKLEPLLG